MNTQDVLNAQEIGATHADLAAQTLQRLILARDGITLAMLHMELRFMLAIIAACKDVDYADGEHKSASYYYDDGRMSSMTLCNIANNLCEAICHQKSLVRYYDEIMTDHIEHNGENRWEWSDSEKEKLTIELGKILA
jgi:hypothetical protein